MWPLRNGCRPMQSNRMRGVYRAHPDMFRGADNNHKRPATRYASSLADRDRIRSWIERRRVLAQSDLGRTEHDGAGRGIEPRSMGLALQRATLERVHRALLVRTHAGEGTELLVAQVHDD